LRRYDIRKREELDITTKERLRKLCDELTYLTYNPNPNDSLQAKQKINEIMSIISSICCYAPNGSAIVEQCIDPINKLKILLENSKPSDIAPIIEIFCTWCNSLTINFVKDKVDISFGIKLNKFFNVFGKYKRA
jgi:uncharacterized protein (UPF0333 family)